MHADPELGTLDADSAATPIEPSDETSDARTALRQAQTALDAFGHATMVVQQRNGRRLWQTALARELMLRYFPDAPDVATPPEVMAWIAREVLHRRAGAEPLTFTVSRQKQRLNFALHAMDDDEGADDGQWLLVLREASETALLQSLMQSFTCLTAREAEVLFWVMQGKTNRDIGEILGTSPRTVHKHLEHVFEKLGVETRTAAAGLAMARVQALRGAA